MISTTGMQPSQPCPRFEFPEILKATEDFSESLVIGNGGFGKVYKGCVINGSVLVVAAIKRFNCMSNQGATEFWAEVEMLSMLRHCNLVSLIGYCIYEEEMILLYEYMPNGTLDDHLHKSNNLLSWLQRLNICVGAGRGLHYLHTGTGIESGVIHRDVKSSNILLHESWSAKISDFGLSKICPTNQPSTHVTTQIKGTFGYLDPNYYKTGMLTRKSDVYAFGVVMLEVLCRKRAVDRSLNEEQWGLVPWVQNSIKKGNLKHIIDSDIRSQISPKCLKEFITLAAKCLHNSPKRRPTMAEVVVGLESILVLQEKFNNSLQSAHKTIFGRMVNMFPFPYSNEENIVEIDSKLSNIKGNCGIARFTISTDNNGSPEMKEVTADSQSPSQSMNEFTFDDLRKATREFSPDLLLGGGDFKKVFLGWVDKKTFAPSKHGDGIAVAIKSFLQENGQGYAEWLAEMYFLGQLAHPNIIRLLGYCRDEHERLLVYEYMPNKSFGHFLFTDGLVGKPLSWGTRISIMIGVARGLVYLHSTEIIHCDLRPSNILLDEKFNVKLGGFRLAKCGPEIWETHVSARIIRTHGYTAPEYHTTGHMSMKSDIYSFGVLLLESITGRRALNPNLPNEKQHLVDWATQIMSERRNVEEIMDPHLEHKYPVYGSFECAVLALRCVANKPHDRPSSKDVLLSLEQISSLNK